MSTGNQLSRRFLTLLSAVALVTGAGLMGARDRVNEICVYGGQVSYCAPER